MDVCERVFVWKPLTLLMLFLKLYDLVFYTFWNLMHMEKGGHREQKEKLRNIHGNMRKRTHIKTLHLSYKTVKWDA